MRKCILMCFTILLSPFSFAGDWYLVGSEKPEAEIDTAALEVKLWEFLNAKTKEEFKPQESYKFQYKQINKHEIYINALCVSSKAGIDDIGRLPDFTLDQLTNDFITIYDGGSCFFGVKFNIKRNKFSELRVNGRA
ncbi:MAG: hypothetical protein AAGC78_17020 [Cellvibrio sp.]|uniref:hypothetical protein n=1 Tax=Cellvibrio sp. TaxID=1965322 RepID=UPI0031A0D8AB